MSAWVGIKRPISPAQGHGERRLEEIKEITKDGESAGRFSFAGEVTAGNGPQHGPVRVIEVYPDGGRGWLVCFSVFLMNFGAWGCNLALSIYMSHYISEAEDFRDIPRSTTSLISGSSLSLMLIVAPFSNYIENMIGIRNCVALGAVINSLGLYLASISTRIEYLLLTQAVIAGIGRGLGIGQTGSGLGGMAFAYITQYFIKNYGLTSSYHVSNAITSALAIPCALCIKSRCPTINADTGEPIPQVGKASVMSLRAMKNWLILIFFVRALFSQWAYSFIRAIIPTYYRQALNESEEGAANLQLLFSLGMAFGRPIMGLISDKLGVTLTAIVCESIALLSYYALWLPAKSFPMIGIHSLLQGSLGGVFFLTALPITKRIATPKDVRSIITVIWLVSALASMLSLYSSLLIVDRAESDGIDTLNSYRIIIYFNSAFIGVAILLSAVLHTKIRRDEKSRNPEDSCNKTKIEHDVLSIAG